MIAAIYARKSTDQTGVADEERSVTRQVDHARAYAVRKGWQVDDAHVYVDDGISGAEFANRPGFLRLMNSLKPRPRFQVLVMSEESRLGREAIETAYALKQLVTGGVRVFFYLEDRERTLDSPTDKIMLSLTAFADELEREKARQRTYDALSRKAQAGHVTGGRVFGYDNVAVPGPGGTRGHVARQINDTEADVVRRIFDLCARGFGMKQITLRLNEDRAASPRPQQGRPAGWAASTVREVLHRPLYRGEIVWNRSRKRDLWGVKHQKPRPEADWLHLEAPDLRIISAEAWEAAHRRLEEARAMYLRATDGRLWGHPARGTESKYLLVGLATCGVCGAGLSVRTRWHGRRRAQFYVCTAYHTRGRSVCRNGHEMPVDVTDRTVLEALADQVLTPDIVREILRRTLERLAAPGPGLDAAPLRTELATVESELGRLTAAVASGADVPSLIAAMREREKRKQAIAARLEVLRQVAQMPAPNPAALERDVLARLAEWKALLGRHVEQARQIVRKVIDGRLTVAPCDEAGCFGRVSGRGSLGRFFSGLAYPKGVASPMGFEPMF